MSGGVVSRGRRRRPLRRPSVGSMVSCVVLLLVGSVVFGGSSRLGATVSSGDRTAYFPLVPARLLDTRSEAEGGGGTVDGQFNGVGALAAGSTLDLQVTSRGGVPGDATGAVFNVTAVGQQGGLSFVTVFPTGTARPNASSLNPSPGAPPAPNGVTAQIGSGGRVSLFTLQGPVHLLVDVVGYFAPHDHDDRYYTKAEVDARIPTAVDTYTKAEIDAGFYTKSQIDTNIFTKVQSDARYYTQALADATFQTQAQTDARYYTKSQVDAKLATTGNLTVGPSAFATASGNARVISTSGCVRNSVANDILFAGLQLPAGASVTAFSASIVDNTANSSTLRLVKETAAPTPTKTTVGTQTSITQQATPVLYTVNLLSPGVLVTAETWWGFEWQTADASDSALLCGATVRYTIPAGTTIG
jgi:hypothetical protein